MKNTLALVLMVFGIVGCATTPSQSQLSGMTNQEVCQTKYLHKGEQRYPYIKEELKRKINCGGENLVSQKKQVEPIIVSQEEADARKATLEKLAFAKKQRIKNQQIRAAELEIEKKEKLRKQKEKILADLKQRCEEYGFTGESNISACIQREAQHDKELAMQKYELEKTRLALQQAQARTYAQNVAEPIQEEEDLPFLIKFLGDVAIGVAEAYADPAFHRDVQQQKQINQLKANQKNDIFRNCRPNC